jgi:cell division protein FtsI/penicillin-binding protein 2
MREYFDKFGFGKTTGVDLEAEASGSLLEIGLWRDISRATMSFGQGISVTPLQMVMAYQTLANKGIPIKPHIVEKIVKSDGSVIETGAEEKGRVISEDTANKVKDMLVSVVDNGHATAARVDGYKVAGKTGTAQIPNDEGSYRENEYVHSFCGFFPADDPQYVALVILDRPKKYKFAATTTTPLFGRLANWLINYSQIKPDN